MLIIASCLIFYAVGIVTNFFANPIFSIFFIVSQETARNIFTYLAVGIAISLIVITSSAILIQKRRNSQANDEKNSKLTPSKNDQKITKYLESSSIEKPIIQLVEQSKTQISAHSKTNEVTATSQEIMSQGKRVCSICQEKFDTPLYQINSSSSGIEIGRICPYCRQSLDSQPENTIDDWWVRTFKSPDSTRDKITT
jgi:hypothetical protein